MYKFCTHVHSENPKMHYIRNAYDSKVVVDILSTTIYSEATSFILIKMTIWFNQITWSL